VADREKEFHVDLTNCDREPIHELGAIQPFGFLIAVSTDWLVKRASANIDATFVVSAEDMLGTPLTDHFDAEAVHTLRNRLTMLRGPDAVERIFGVPVRLADGKRPFDFALHMIDSTIVIEGEPSDPDLATDAASAIRAMMGRLDEKPDLTDFFREGARQVRALTGFDRVMVYKFDPDGSGIVVAEAARAGIGSFLDLRYPASDIPKQARKLYLRTPFRIIADVDAQPVPVVPQRDETGAPIDLSLSVLRSVSPIHIEYLKNMGVHASMSISIIVEGRLWGLFACHHYAGPRCPGFERRSIAELFGQMFALKLESRERKALSAYETRARDQRPAARRRGGRCGTARQSRMAGRDAARNRAQRRAGDLDRRQGRGQRHHAPARRAAAYRAAIERNGRRPRLRDRPFVRNTARRAGLCR